MTAVSRALRWCLAVVVAVSFTVGGLAVAIPALAHDDAGAVSVAPVDSGNEA